MRIEQLQDTRYVSASAAAWRILAYDIVDKTLSVYRLEDSIYFEERPELPAAFTAPQTELTTNAKYPGANHPRYDEFPRLFTCNSSDKVWKPRAKFRKRVTRGAGPSSARAAETSEFNFERPGEIIIGRMYPVSPPEGKRYFLCMLLLLIAGDK